jgi:hypothetical protein
MPIQFNSLLSSAVANATFLDKTIADTKTGQLTLRKTDVDPTPVLDVQQSILDLDSLTQSDLVNGVIKLREYATDTEYELDNGAPPYTDFTAAYYNSTTGLIRYYDGVAAEWKPVGSQIIGDQERLGVGDGLTTIFSLSTVPLNDDAIGLYLNGVLVEKTDYSVSGSQITFNTAPAVAQVVYAKWFTDGTPSSPPISSGSFEAEYREVNATEFANKELTLNNVPADPTKVIVDIIDGSTQEFGVDFTVLVNNVSWNGLGMDGDVAIGTKIRFVYIT